MVFGDGEEMKTMYEFNPILGAAGVKGNSAQGISSLLPNWKGTYLILSQNVLHAL